MNTTKTTRRRGRQSIGKSALKWIRLQRTEQLYKRERSWLWKQRGWIIQLEKSHNLWSLWRNLLLLACTMVPQVSLRWFSRSSRITWSKWLPGCLTLKLMPWLKHLRCPIWDSRLSFILLNNLPALSTSMLMAETTSISSTRSLQSKRCWLKSKIDACKFKLWLQEQVSLSRRRTWTSASKSAADPWSSMVRSKWEHVANTCPWISYSTRISSTSRIGSC